MYLNRTIIKFGGESGQGINTVGKMLTQAVNRLGLYTFSTREYPSLIKGGVASYQIDISDKAINSSSRKSNILCLLSKEAFHTYLFDLLEGGVVVYDGEELELSADEDIFMQKNNISLVYLDSNRIATDSGGTAIMSNAVLAGFLWKIMKQDVEILVEEVLEMLEGKNIDMDAERACILAGYNNPSYRDHLSSSLLLPQGSSKKLVMTGNDALSLGALAGGLRAYYGYPMTPATSIFKFLGESASESKIVIKQAENEITAVQMALGSMYMGTRALVATSGGGYDLMIETISCAGMTETPLVIVLSQRAGAGTGVPTWTGSADIYTAAKGGHGEFPRCVIAVSDLESSYRLIQKAFNIADKYQLPVTVLTEKQISESTFSADSLPQNEKIERGLQSGEKRYEITESGISPRWIPTKEEKPYIHTSDEHTEEGYSTENSEEITAMTEKRARKMQTLADELPQPLYFGPSSAQTVFVGSGSSKNTLLDSIALLDGVGYLHYEYIYPTKTELLMKLVNEGKRLILIEANQTGQLGSLITDKCGYQFKEKFLKYDGRPFFVEDILDYLEQ